MKNSAHNVDILAIDNHIDISTFYDIPFFVYLSRAQ
jgi:hypothetical protein